MTVKLGYCIHCGQANITCINTAKDGTMTHYSVAKQGECGPLMIDDVEIPEPNWKALVRTPPQKPAQEPVPDLVEQLSGLKNDWTSAGAKTYGLPLSPPETARRWRCSECKRTDITKDEVMLDNGISLEGVLGHLVTGEGWPYWCGPVVLEKGQE